MAKADALLDDAEGTDADDALAPADLLTPRLPSPYDLFETDTDLEKEGVWLDFGTFELKCAASGDANPEFQARWRELLAPVAEAIDTGLLGPEVEQQLLMRAYSETIVRSARGNFVNRQDEAIPKTPDGYYGLFMDLPRLFRLVRQRTLALDTYRKKRDESVGGE